MAMDIALKSAAAMPDSEASKMAKANKIYETFMDELYERAFVLFCFFEDLHSIENNVTATWQDYRDGRINLLAATAITEAAVCLIRRYEQDITASLYPDDKTDTVFWWMTMELNVVDKINQGQDPGTFVQGLEVTPFDYFMFMPTARTLEKFAKAAIMSKEHKMNWPPPVPPMRVNYATLPEGLGLMDRPDHKKMQQEDELLTQLMMDMMLVDSIRNAAKPRDEMTELMAAVQEDVLIGNLRQVWKDGQYSITAIVAAQLILNIIDVVGDRKKKALDDLKTARDHVDMSLAITIDPVTRNASTADINWPQKGTQLLLPLVEMLHQLKLPVVQHMKRIALTGYQPRQSKRLNRDNLTPEIRQQVIEKYGEGAFGPIPAEIQHRLEAVGLGEGFQMAQPDRTHDFLELHDPMFSGTVGLRIASEYERVGLSVTNHQFTIFLCAHLYNAVKQVKLLSHEWPAMERIIQLHKKAIFADEIPTRTADIADRFEFRLRHTNGGSIESQKWTLRSSGPSEALRGYLTAARGAAEDRDRAFWMLQRQVQISHATLLEAAPSTDSSAVVSTTSTRIVAKKPAATGPVSAQKMMNSLRSALPHMIDDMTIDYVRLTKQCKKLLEIFRTLFNAESEAQGIPVPPHKAMTTDPKSLDPDLTALVRDALGEAKSVRAMGIYTYLPGEGDVKGVRGTQDHGDLDEMRHGVGLLVASKLFNNLLSKKQEPWRLTSMVPKDAGKDLKIGRALQVNTDVNKSQMSPQEKALHRRMLRELNGAFNNSNRLL